MTAALANGPLREHTLAVNEVGLVFVSAARARGDECGPNDWDNEVAFRVTDRRAGRALSCAWLTRCCTTPGAGPTARSCWPGS